MPSIPRDNLWGMNPRSYYAQPLFISGIFSAFFITILRGLRWPSDWAEAHWLISYQFGFLKRALPGTLIAQLTRTSHAETVIRLVSSVIMLSFCLALFWICYRTISRSQYSIENIITVLAFVTSSYVVMSAHLIGYFDHIIILITITASWLVLREKIWPAALLISIGILVHETIFIVGFPSLIFLAVIIQSKDPRAQTPKALLAAFFSRFKLLILIPVICLLLILIFQAVFLETAETGMQIASHLEQYDFVQENRHVFVAYALTASFQKQLQNQSQYFLQRILDIEFLIIVIFPLTLIFLHCCRLVSGSKFRIFIRFLLSAVILFPLFLHAVAWDTSRIWTYPLVVAMLGLWSICEVFSQSPGAHRINFVFSIAAVVMVILQVFATTELMDGAEERFSVLARVLLYAPSFILIAAAAILQTRTSNDRSAHLE